MKFPFLKSEERVSESYIGILLKDSEGTVFLFKNNLNKITIIRSEKFIYSNGWNSLTEDIDELLLKLENKQEKQINKAVFFLYAHLLEKGTHTIKRGYLAKIKELSRKLEIKPIGYIECHEALVSYLEKKEQLPVTAIIIEVDSQQVNVFVYKSGHRVIDENIPRTDDVMVNLDRIFKEIHEKTLLPSRIILYNSTNLNELSSQIASYRWSSGVFIQPPRTEIAQENEITQALFDFFNQQLSSTVPPIQSQDKKENVMGFVIGGDVIVKETATETVPLTKTIAPRLKISIPWRNLMNKIRNIKFKNNVVFIIGIVLLIFLIILYEGFLHRAKVTVLFKGQSFDKNITENIDLTEPAGEDQLSIINASISAQLSESASTTGKKQVGESARGEVVLYNFDEKEKLLTKGTILETAGMRFLLDSDVKIASSSLTTDASAKLPGKTKGKVSADVIGAEANLGKGQRFKIADLPTFTYFGINEVGFTGGSKKEVLTVSQKDIADLKSAILEKGKREIVSQISKKTIAKGKLIDILTEYEIGVINASKEIGEETNKIEMEATVIGNYYLIDKSTIGQFLRKNMSAEIPDDYELNLSQAELNIIDASKNNEEISLDLNIKINAIKQVDEKKLLKKIAGYKRSDLERLLKSDYSANGFELKVEPQLPILKNYLPIRSNNIELKISSL